MHRVFMQGLGILLGFAGIVIATNAAEMRYVILFGGTMMLTWALCRARQRMASIDLAFKRLAM